MVRRVFGAFAAVQTFVWLARGDRFEVLFWFTGESWLYVLLLWLKDLALAAAAGWVAARLLGLVTDAAARGEREPSPPLRPAAEAACVVPALALGVALRWVFSSWNPAGLWVDVVYAARPLFGGGTPPLWGASPFGQNPASHEVVSNLYVAFVRGVFALFGSGETGFFAISALPGSLAVPAAWWLAREAFGARVAAVAALLGALLGWPLLLARWSSTSALLLALVFLAAAATLRARRTGSVALAAFAGACVGASLHTHASAGAVAAGFAAFALLEARKAPARRLVLAAAAAAALAAAPLALAFAGGPGRLGGHLRDVHIGTPAKGVDGPRATGGLRIPVALASNALDYTGALLWTIDPNERNAAGRAAVTPAVGVLAILGIGLAASRRRPADVLLLLLAAGSLLAGVLSNPDGAPNTLRISALLVPALVLAAAVLEAGIGQAARSGAVSRGVLVAGLAAALVVTETLPALLDAPSRPGVAVRFCAAETEAGRTLARLAAAPVVLERRADLSSFVVEAVAHGADRRIPLNAWAKETPAGILAAPPTGAFWVLASRAGLAELAAGGLHCARGIAPGGGGFLLARVRPRG
jgi:hypothetical protein